MKQRIKFGSLFLFLLIAILAVYGYFRNKAGNSSILPDRSRAHISAQSLIRMAGSGDTLLSKYLYNVITVRGAIHDIRIGPTGVYNISLGASPAYPDLLIDCILDSLYNKRHPDWRPGDTCTIQGICAGQLHNVILLDCIVENMKKN